LAFEEVPGHLDIGFIILIARLILYKSTIRVQETIKWYM